MCVLFLFVLFLMKCAYDKPKHVCMPEWDDPIFTFDSSGCSSEETFYYFWSCSFSMNSSDTHYLQSKNNNNKKQHTPTNNSKNESRHNNNKTALMIGTNLDGCTNEVIQFSPSHAPLSFTPLPSSFLSSVSRLRSTVCCLLSSVYSLLVLFSVWLVRRV